MTASVLAVHPGLASSSRLPVLAHEGERLRHAELLLLVGAGVAAAFASVFLDLGLRIPGHAILRAVFPMAFGLALAPRRVAGTIMGVSALGTAFAIQTCGLAAVGFGAMTSLTLIGPILDIALQWTRRGWTVYVGFVIAGIASNLAAFAVRFSSKLLGFEHAGKRTLAEWWPQAIGTYVLCGALAGLISAAVWFRFVSRRRGDGSSEIAG